VVIFHHPDTQLALAHVRFLSGSLSSFHHWDQVFRTFELLRLLGLVVAVILVVVVVIGIEQLVVLATLHLASIAFVAEGEVEVVTFQADPVLRRIVCRTAEQVGRNPFTNLTHVLFYNSNNRSRKLYSFRGKRSPRNHRSLQIK